MKGLRQTAAACLGGRSLSRFASPPFTLTTPRFKNEEEYGEKAWITGLSRPGRNLWITEREQPKNRYDAFLFRDIFELTLIETK